LSFQAEEMSRSGAASDLAKRNYFRKQLLYVQHVDKEKDTDSEFSEQSLHEYFLKDSQIFSDKDFSRYERTPTANVGILKSYLEELITEVKVLTNPLPIPLKSGVTIHAFVFFKTWNKAKNEKMCYSMEKNGQYIILQQSPNERDVTHNIYDPEKKMFVERFGQVVSKVEARGNFKAFKNLLRAIWETSQINTNYNLLFANCQNFASFVFKKANYRQEFKWSTWISALSDLFEFRKKKTEEKSEISADIIAKKKLFEKDDKFEFYKAMIEGNKNKFEELAENNLPSESINSVDSLGYTLLEWATVFSTSDWPIDQFLREKGAKIQTDDEGLFRRNVFYIALQYLPSNKESQYLSFDGIDIRGVNQMGDTALHLALYGEKWDVAERILNQFPDYDVNVTNSSKHSPFYLAVQLDCKMTLMKKILAKTNSGNINKSNENRNVFLIGLQYSVPNDSRYLSFDGIDIRGENKTGDTALYLALYGEKWDKINQQNDGDTALHYAIKKENKTLVVELLKEEKVEVNRKNKKDQMALHLAAQWVDIPNDLFRLILGKSADVKVESDGVQLVNAQDAAGETALHLAIKYKSKNATKQLLEREDVNVNLKNKKNKQTALHFAAEWKNMPNDLFSKILGKSTNVNAKDKCGGNTALNATILRKSEAAVKELLKGMGVDVNLKNDYHKAALHFAAEWKNIPVDLFKKILEKTSDVNEQEEFGNTALHLAIHFDDDERKKNVDVNIKDNRNQTALHLASQWVDIPNDLFRLILEKSANVNVQSDGVNLVNAQNKDGDTALHYAITVKSKTAIKELLKHNDVDVKLENKDKRTVLHFAAFSMTPIDLFKTILKKSTDFVNAQDKYGWTALHWAIKKEYKAVVGELLKCKDVDFNIKNNNNQTALNLCSEWKDIPANLLKIINEKTTAENKAEDQNEAT
jgi:ankyrin repeat protein